MPDPSTIAERRALGGGFYLFPEPPGSAFLWRLEAGFVPPGWTARHQRRSSDPVFPGSALAIAWLMRLPIPTLQPLAKLAGETALVWFYLLPEALARLYSAGYMNEPMGTLLLALPTNVVRAFKTALRSSTQVDTSRPTTVAGDDLLDATDIVRPLPGGGLEILSRLPKEHWTLDVTGISYRGELFAFTERGLRDENTAHRYRFELRRAGSEQVFSSYQVYEPEEVRAIYRDLRRRRSATWVETFAVLWGLLDGPTQQRLADTYRYPPGRMTRWALVLTATLGGLLVAGGVSRLETAAPGALIEITAGLALGGETLWRWRALHTGGEAPASWLGYLLQPLALRALRWRHD